LQELRRIRKERGLTQRELADASGVDHTTISMIETGKRRPHLETLDSLALVLDVEVADLLGKAEPRLPFDVDAIKSEVVGASKPGTVRELREALDQAYRKQFEGWSLEDLQDKEAELLEDVRMWSAEVGPDKPYSEEMMRRFLRVSDELRAVMVARAAKGVPYRDRDAQKQ